MKEEATCVTIKLEMLVFLQNREEDGIMIKSTGIIRKVDKLGRVVIPLETRNLFGIEEQNGIELLVDEENGYIILQKASPVCIKCHSAKNLKEIKPGFYLCHTCIEELR